MFHLAVCMLANIESGSTQKMAKILAVRKANYLMPVVMVLF